MTQLGMKDKIRGTELLEPLENEGRPESWRYILKPGHKVICGYDRGGGELLIACDNLVEMQQLYDAYARGAAVRIQWYSVPELKFVYFIRASKTGETFVNLSKSAQDDSPKRKRKKPRKE